MNSSLCVLSRALLCVALCSALAACSVSPGRTPGDTVAPTDRQGSAIARTIDREAVRQSKAAAGRAPFLASPFGHIAAPDAAVLPADPSVRTRADLYMTRIEAEDLAFWLGGQAVWVDVGCCGDWAIDTALGTVAGIAAAHDFADDVAVFVSGADLRLAAQVVDRLSELGFTRAILVTQ